MKKILLVEPAYKAKYPPLGLMKISTFHKQAGDEVQYVKGLDDSLPLKSFDVVYITSLFTYEAAEVIRTVNFYKDMCPNADIMVGGIYASVMPDHVKANTGIEPHVGLWMDVEFLPPDYSLFPDHRWSNHSFVFTSRGCPNKCEFCVVKTLEPKKLINPRWKEHISTAKPRIMVHDNNITAMLFEHFEEVLSFLASTRKLVTFDNGFDCRLFTERHCRLVAKLNIQSVRFAFDSVRQDGHIQKALEMCLNHGIPASKIIVFILFNHNDTLEDAEYRAREVAKLGVRPYAMEFMPLDATELFSYYYGEWNQELCKDFAVFINHARIVSAFSFDKWRARKEKERSGTRGGQTRRRKRFGQWKNFRA
jgi:hypothetical protein